MLQTSGHKQWTVHEPVHTDPLASQPWTGHRAAITQRVAGEPVIDTVLGPGDALYLPRGWVHSARAQGALSIHLTIGVSATTGMDVVRAVVDQLEDVAEFRKSLPMGTDPTDRHEMVAPATKIMAEPAETLREHASDLSEDAATRLMQRYADRTRPVAVAAAGNAWCGRTGGHNEGAVAHGLPATSNTAADASCCDCPTAP